MIQRLLCLLLESCLYVFLIIGQSIRMRNTKNLNGTVHDINHHLTTYVLAIFQLFVTLMVDTKKLHPGFAQGHLASQ